MPALLQDVIVTLAALWAVWLIVRRMGAVVSPGAGRTASCDNCASSQAGGRPDKDSAKPLTLIR